MPIETSPIPTGAAALADLLRAHTQGPIFHVPGEGVLELIDALADDVSGPRLVTCRHENASVIMAASVGSMNLAEGGKPAVCLVGRAPGTLNAALALHGARTDETPLLLIAGDGAARNSGRDTMLGEELVAALRAITGNAVYCQSAERLEESFAQAMTATLHPRPGVGVLVVAEDVWNAVLPAPLAIRPHGWPALVAPTVSSEQLDLLAQRLAQAARPLVIVGGGDWSDGECQALQAQLERLALPALAAYRFADILDAASPSSAGEIGIGADPRLLAAVAEADLVILAGARLSELNTFATGSFEGFRLLREGTDANPRPELVVIGPDQADLFRAYPIDRALWGRSASVIPALAAIAEAPSGWREWCARLRTLREKWIALPSPSNTPSDTPTGTPDAPPVDPRELIGAIEALYPAPCVFTVGAGRYAHLPQRHVRTTRPQRYFGPKSGAMGHGLPAAIGAALARPGQRAICFAGDGCFAMSGFELSTARLYDANVTCIVFNDSRFSAIAGNQTRHFGRSVGTDLAPIDFAALAQSMGVPATRATSLGEYKDALARSWSMTGPFLIEIPVYEGVPFAKDEARR